MTYRQTLEYLYNQYPVFQRIGASAYKPDLNNTLALLEILNDPQCSFKSVHIAGTNGKGSTSHMLASIFQEAGYKTGLYTSPHLKDFRERIRINGKMISKDRVIRFTENHKSHFESIHPSFFEVTVAMAFDYFREKKVDIAIIETGLGGRLDSTNVISPELSVITNIGYDHMQFLGDTLPKIAGEKAGIIKKNTPVLIGEYQAETQSVFLQKASLEHSPLVFASKNKIRHSFSCELKGDFQKKNINTVLHAIRILREKGWKITDGQIRKGLSKVVRNTGLRGRWETLSVRPKVIADIAHNKDGIQTLLLQLKKEKYNQLHCVIGMVNDKDVASVVKLLPKRATYYFTRASIPRAMNETELLSIGNTAGLNGKSYSSVQKAIHAAKKNAKATDLILITGSAFVVAEAI